MRILIVEDEQAMANGLRFNFQQEGYEVTHADDGPSALTFFENAQYEGNGSPFDVIVLDLMLPGMSGYEACRRIRQIDGDVPILVLSARSLSEDRAMAFDAGTDQYLTKPFDLRELLSRVRNLVARRRSRTAPPVDERAVKETYCFGNVTLNVRKFELTVGDKSHALTSRELELLRYFIRNEGHVLSRQQILRDVWGESAEMATRTIDNFVLRLRKLVEPDPAAPRHILSVRGTGYRFRADGSEAEEEEE